MIRRPILVAAAATALILAPSVAMADGYNAPGYGCFLTPAKFVTGHHLKVHCSQGHEKAKPEKEKKEERETLTIKRTSDSIKGDGHKSDGTKSDGTKSMTATSVDGAVTFDVSFDEPGTYALALTNAAGVLRSSQTVVIHADLASATTASGVLSSSSGPGSTGSDRMPIVLGGGVLVLFGAGAGVAARRRKSAKVPD